ncbi:sensor histidine kinase [Virgibacillus sp. 179-BFC.A HS]|uniref:histidine kinase n=1 Tax=Tigheibacillus jepli TaxID=3035914 RepID=A0ABU5CKQ7_9BACI|nr:sensor histidine kinase [Virgibacillus sp. 179-BFC.A HS]MDY0406939.1 sensor histidine kinase [Virgibacillus sp. 179-BFC.A HS]
MERCLISAKMVLLLFVVFSIILEPGRDVSWAVLLILLYICANFSIYLFKSVRLKTFCLLLSAALAIVGYGLVHPLFILLLPLAILECLHEKMNHQLIAQLISLVPMFYIQTDMRPLYVLVALVMGLLYRQVANYDKKLATAHQQLDTARENYQSLVKRLHERDSYLKQSAYMLKLEERNKISQEIHDNIGHSITGALIQMEAAKSLLQRNPQKAEKLLQNAIGITKEGIESIRLTLKNLKPSIEHIGISRLKLYLNEFAAKQHISTILTHYGDMERILPLQWKIIFDNMNEALTNALRYSEATRITVDITVLNKLIKLEVKDNGRGIDILEKGLGIIGMEERAAAADGKVIIDGKSGFSVTTLLPIQT